MIDATRERGVGPKEMLADSLYGADDNSERERTVKLISRVIGKVQGTGLTLADFTWTDELTVRACRQGDVAVRVKHKKGKHTAIFAPEVCTVYPRIKDCQVKAGKKGSDLYYDEKALRLAKRRAYEKRPSFQEVYRFRAGIEGTVSQLGRETGLKHLRVRGVATISFCATLKGAAFNLLRTVAFGDSQEDRNLGLRQRNLACLVSFLFSNNDFQLYWLILLLFALILTVISYSQQKDRNKKIV